VFTLGVIGITHLLRVLLVPPPLSAIGAVASVMMGPSSLGTGGVEPSSKGGRPWSLLPVYTWYAYGVDCQFTLLSLFLFLP
jgi:hypothetical protein